MTDYLMHFNHSSIQCFDLESKMETFKNGVPNFRAHKEALPTLVHKKKQVLDLTAYLRKTFTCSRIIQCAKMLYYLYEFMKALIWQPLTIVTKTKRLYKIWRMDKLSKMKNEVMYINDLNRMCNAPHYTSMQCEYAQCSNNHLGRIIEYLDDAKYCIDVAVYALNSAPISRALRKAHERGIAVRIITEKCYLRQISKVADALGLKDIPMVIPRPRSDRMMHHKICIVDGYRRSREIRKPKDRRKVASVLMTGSFNWIAFQHSYDDLLITSNVTLILKIEQEFFRIWKSIQLNNI